MSSYPDTGQEAIQVQEDTVVVRALPGSPRTQATQ